ncbi:hypothetical protein [Rhodohalobacter halophilus]|uniref:hypothetical protein n=1 Tax=Rhodohalobacter halophilus TaxID=1812810 RepID=UPI00083F99A0|nr:hypothetical protein [Rhodohalobacter halophilus]
MWSDILLILASAFCATYATFSIRDRHRDVRNVFIISFTSVILYQIHLFIDYQYITVVNELLLLTVFTSLLSILLLTIRKLKPAFARYPYVISFFPFIIVLLYPLIAGEIAIIYLVIQLLQAAALISLLLIIISHMDTNQAKMLTIITFFLLLASGIFYWFKEMVAVDKWLWQTLTAIAMSTGIYAFSHFYKDNEQMKNYDPNY